MSRAREIERFIKKGMRQVFLLACPATLPFSFAIHPWFVVNDTKTVSRYGVGWHKSDPQKEFVFWGHHCTECRGYMHKDGRPPHEGIAIFPFAERPLWNGRIIGKVQGGKDSTAARMVNTIRESIRTYPYAEQYSLFGPNSNTYVQWILNQFPDSGLVLPWNSFGKNYKR